MAKAKVISKSKLTKKDGYASLKQKTYATASNNELLNSVSGNLTKTSNGTAELTYNAYKKKR